MILRQKYSIVLPFLMVAFSLLTLNGYTQVETKNPDSEFILKGNHFVPRRPWVTIGLGYGYNFSESMGEPNFFMDFLYQFKDKYQCIGAGYLTSRDQFLDHGNQSLFLPHSYVRHSTNSLHALYGWRIERMRHNFAFSAGPAYNWGYRHSHIDSLGRPYHEAYREIGLYANLQYSFKIFYDIGTGLSLWGSYSSHYKVMGLSWHIYLSSAFKRKL